MYIGNQVNNNPFNTDVFSGNGAATSFGPLSRAPASSASIAVYVNGLYKTPGYEYTVTGTQINFVTPPSAVDRNIVILHLGSGAAAGVVADNTVTNAKLVDRAVTGPKIGLNAISSNNIQVGSITGNLIAQNSIRANQIVAGTITGNLFANNTITGDKIVESTITGNLISANSITGNQIVAGTITGNLIAVTSIRANQIATGSLTGNLFANNTITGDKIGPGAVSANNLNSSAIAALSGVGTSNWAMYTSPGTFSIPASTTKLKITIVGGGGGSGGVRAGVNDTSSGGGGGGGTTVAYINIGGYPSTAIYTTINVTVGVGGAGGIGTPSSLTSANNGNTSNVVLWTALQPTAPLYRMSFGAYGGVGSPSVDASTVPAITGGTTGNVVAGSGGSGANSGIYLTLNPGLYPPSGSGSEAFILYYQGFRGNIGSYDANTSTNAIATAGQSYGFGSIGAGALGVRAAAPKANTPGLQGANGAVLIEY